MKLVKWIICFVIIVSGCNSDTNETNNNSPNAHSNKVLQLNICILLDLSDRIDTAKYPATPQHYERDIENIKTVTRIFKNKIETKKIFDLQDKLNIYFHPMPKGADIISVASKLKIDLAGKEKDEISKIYENVENDFYEGSKNLYKLVVKSSGDSGKFPGSNIWRFIKDEVVNKCIEKDSSYRNILIIITDGYMYYSSEMKRDKNRFSYIEKDYDHLKKFRQASSLSNFDKDDYGFIPVQGNLSNLEILVLEIAPPEKHPEDYDILKKYWEKWFEEMKVKKTNGKYYIEKSDLPINTEKSIKNFFG